MIFTGASRNASIMLGDLQPSSSYVVFILTKSTSGSIMTLDDMLNSSISVETSCCRDIILNLASKTALSDSSYLNFISGSFNYMSSQSLMLTLRVYSSQRETLVLVSDIIAPSLVFLMNQRAIEFDLLSLNAGFYLINASLVGAEAFKYRVIFSDSASSITNFTSKPSNSSLPAPFLTAAEFSSDGGYLTILFSGATDQSGLPNQFACSELFHFNCSSDSICTWKDSATVIASIAPFEFCISPGDYLRLSNHAQIRSECPARASCDNHMNWAVTSLNSSLLTQLPDKIEAPSIIISLPEVVGRCSGLLFDFSSSYGSGGRPWKKREVYVYSDAAANTTSRLQDSLYSQLSGSDVSLLHIPYELLTPGASYNFVLVLCNFLSACSQSSKQTTILYSIQPTVIIPGSSLRTMKSKDNLKLSASASISLCNQSESLNNFDYSWSVYSGNSIQVAYVSNSKNPAVFQLVPYSLSVNSLYHIIVSAAITSDGALTSSVAATDIFIVSGDIVIVLSESDAEITVDTTELIYILEYQSINLNASLSYDEDKSERFGTSAGLYFSWSCLVKYPHYSDNCSSVLNITSHSSYEESFNFNVKGETAGAYMVISLSVSDLDHSREAYAAVNYAVLERVGRLTTTLAKPSSITRSLQTVLTGSIGIPANSFGNLTWRSTDWSSQDLISKCLSPTSIPVEINGVSYDRSFNLIIAPNILSPGATYTFILDYNMLSIDGHYIWQGSTSILVKANSPPQPGVFLTAPSFGTELETAFVLSCQQWQDSELPLSFQFKYIQISGFVLTIQSRSESAFTTTQLTAGLALNNYSITCVTEVFNVLDANSTVSSTVRVSPHTSLNTQTAVNQIIVSLSSSKDVDFIKSKTSFLGYLLNKADCSLAPSNCNALNRLPCYNVPNTCGPCLSSAYIGTPGYANDMCIDPFVIKDVSNVQRRVLKHSLRSGSHSCSGHCDIHESGPPREMGFHAQEALMIPKQCPNNCSGHGFCQFLSVSTSAPIDYCAIGDLSCYAACACSMGYTMSESCKAVSNEAFETRYSLISSQAKLLELEDISIQSVVSIISGLNEAVLNQYELSSASLQLVVSMAATILKDSKRYALPVTATESVLSILDKASKAIQTYHASYQNDTLEWRNSTIGAIKAAIASFASQVSDLSVPEQFPQSWANDNFRMTVGNYLLPMNDSFCMKYVMLSMPNRPLEAYLNVPQSNISVPICNPIAQSVVMSVSTNSLDYLVHGDSAPVQFDAPVSPCHSDMDCNVSISLPRIPTVPDQRHVRLDAYNSSSGGSLTRRKLTNTNESSSEGEVVDVVCNEAIDSYFIFRNCSNGHLLQIFCNGSAMFISAKCPYEMFIPSCNRAFLESSNETLSYGDYTTSGCRVVGYNDKNIICSCGLVNAVRNASTPSIGYQDQTISISYIALLESSIATQRSTILSATRLRGSTLIRQGRYAVIMIGALLVGIVLLMFVCYFTDRQSKRSHAKKKLALLPEVVEPEIIASQLRSLAADTIPGILKARSLEANIGAEMKNNHYWFSPFLHYNDDYPRVIRGVILATEIIIVLFIDALTYNLTSGSDSNCAPYSTEELCLQPRSAYKTGTAMCYWRPMNSPGYPDDGQCLFVQPNSHIEILIFVTVFSTIITTPIATVIDIVVARYLVPPTGTTGMTKVKISPRQSSEGEHDDGLDESMDDERERERENRVENQRRKRGIHVHMVFLIRRFRIRLNLDLPDIATAIGAYDEGTAQESRETRMYLKEFEKMKAELRAFRESEDFPSSALEQFDAMWGLNAKGEFIDKTVEDAILEDFASMHEKLRDEVKFLRAMSDEERNKRLLFLLQRDMLPLGVQRQIIEDQNPSTELEYRTRPVSLFAKALTLGFVLILNLSMLFYVLLFALSQGSGYQEAWIQSFVLWFFIDVLITSSLIVITTKILLPVFFSGNIKRAFSIVNEMLTRTFLDHPRGDSHDDHDGAAEEQIAEAESVAEAVAEIEAETEAEAEAEVEIFTPEAEIERQQKRSVGSKGFNAAKHLYVSSHLASLFPHCPASKVVRAYQTIFPSRLYTPESEQGHFLTSTANFLLHLIIFVVSTFLSSSSAVQNGIIKIFTVVFVGYVLLLHVRLYRIYPELAALPAVALLLFIIAVRLFYSLCHNKNKNSSQQRHSKEATALPLEAKARSSDEVCDVQNKNSQSQSSASESSSRPLKLQTDNTKEEEEQILEVIRTKPRQRNSHNSASSFADDLDMEDVDA